MGKIKELLTNRDFLVGLAIGVVGVIAYNYFYKKPTTETKKVASAS